MMPPQGRYILLTGHPVTHISIQNQHLLYRPSAAISALAASHMQGRAHSR